MSTDSKSKKDKGSEPAIKLPPSGFAEEVLGSVVPQPGSVPLAPMAAASVVPGPATDSLYTFADNVRRSEGVQSAAQEEQLETWVTFSLARESFGLPVTHVQEILRVTGITRVPHAPPAVRGVTNMRGRVLPVVDLRVRLGLEEREVDPQCRILVVSSRGRLLGLLVDSVQQVVRLAHSSVQPPPPDIMTAQSDFILGVCHLQGTMVILLLVDRVLQIKGSLQPQ